MRIYIYIYIYFIIFVYQYKSGAPHREGSELSLKRVTREQTEEEAGNHKGLSATEPPVFLFHYERRGIARDWPKNIARTLPPAGLPETWTEVMCRRRRRHNSS
jgi:hypothetical protein